MQHAEIYPEKKHWDSFHVLKSCFCSFFCPFMHGHYTGEISNLYRLKILSGRLLASFHYLHLYIHTECKIFILFSADWQTYSVYDIQHVVGFSRFHWDNCVQLRNQTVAAENKGKSNSIYRSGEHQEKNTGKQFPLWNFMGAATQVWGRRQRSLQPLVLPTTEGMICCSELLGEEKA